MLITANTPYSISFLGPIYVNHSMATWFTSKVRSEDETLIWTRQTPKFHFVISEHCTNNVAQRFQSGVCSVPICGLSQQTTSTIHKIDPDNETVGGFRLRESNCSLRIWNALFRTDKTSADFFSISKALFSSSMAILWSTHLTAVKACFIHE